MGQAVSRERDEALAALKPINNSDDLIREYQSLAKGFCLSPAENEWFKLIFAKFCSSSGAVEYWSEDDLFQFLRIIFPAEVTSTVERAIPCLHSMLRRLGSFPYTLLPIQTLTLSVLRAAVIILIHRDDSRLRANTDGDSPATYSAGLIARRRRVLFQSLATHNTGPPEKIHRSNEDDEDLLEALQFVEQYNYVTLESNMSCNVRGPPIPSTESFPSSWSRKLDIQIRYQDFKALVRLLLVSQSDHAMINMQQSDDSVAGFDGAAAFVCNAFASNEEDIGWGAFNQALGSSMPNLFDAFPRIFGPLIHPKPEIQFQLQSARNEEATLLRSSIQWS